MSKRNTATKINKNTSNNKPSNSKQQYNVIINQNSTFNQDNSINIMLDSNFPYFQNYNLQSNEFESSNQIYPFYEHQQLKNQNNINNSISSKKISESDNKNNNNNISPKNLEKETNLNSLKENFKKIEISPKKKKNALPYEEMEQELTNKIDYRYLKKCPVKELISTFKIEEIENDNNDNEQLFWFAAYGKLMKTKHLIKILNYYNNKPFEQYSNKNSNYSNKILKEKTLIIKDFEIYFHENSNKPFIRYSKGGTIYTKLYLLSLEEISRIFSYINRIEYKIDNNRLNYLQRKGAYEFVNDNNNGIILPYCLIYYLGKYMNINIYSFSNNIDINLNLDEISFDKNQRISSYTVLNNNNGDKNYFSNDNIHNRMNDTNINRFNYKLPNSKKIAKLIKIINLNFPDLSIDEIINYLIPENKYINSITKINEIKNIFFFKKSNQNKFILSSMVRDTIKGISIHTPKSLISSFCPCESIIENGSFKNSDLFQPANKKYAIPIKDDYKFQTINTNEKDNNKNNPFIIYVCDNVQKINFVDNQNTNKYSVFNANDDNNNNSNINTNIDYIENNIENNHENNKNNNNKNITYNNSKNYLNAGISQQKSSNNRYKSNDINIPNINDKIENNCISSENYIRQTYNQLNNRVHKIPKEKINNKRATMEPKKRQNKCGNNCNNVSISGVKKDVKNQKISTDFLGKDKSEKYNNLTGTKNCRNKKYGTNAISHTNIIGNKKNGTLNKSIDGHNNYVAKFRLSRTSDINQRRKQKTKANNTMLINRFNMNKKDIENPFFKLDS